MGVVWGSTRPGPSESEVCEKEAPREPWGMGRLTWLGGLLAWLLTAMGWLPLASYQENLINIDLLQQSRNTRTSKRTE